MCAASNINNAPDLVGDRSQRHRVDDREYAVAPAMISRGRSRLAISRTLSKSMRSSLLETP
jgi:hypothetical protein